MSYTRRFSKTITVRYSGTVTYPPSKTGGVSHYSGSAHETVNFDVHVNTEPFDYEVGEMKDRVDLLTGSVVATEAAHVNSIRETTKKIGDTIIAGFFKTVKSDISQQIAQLKITSETLLMQMNKLAQRCRDKKRQMSVDYQRISDRYVKIFTDLNKELENRIYSIDEPVFHASRLIDGVESLEGKEDAVATVSVSSGENAHVHSMLAANLAKKQAIDAIEKGKRFLNVQYATDTVIEKCLMPEAKGSMLSTPFCLMEATRTGGATDREIFASPLLKNIDNNTLGNGIDAKGWDGSIDEDSVKAISDYFNQEVAAEREKVRTDHDQRVADLTSRLFNLSRTAAPGK
ncbi:MAG: hypothetical protein K2N05_12160 [Muribaculaceae bacterium]|nr:hypothetical protein [Muribaculaceae bacterium]